MTLLQKLLFAHALVTLAAGIVLVAMPAAIPGAIGVSVTSGGFVLCYFLAGAEFSIAFLSYLGARSNSAEVIRVVVQTIIALHGTTAILEIYAIARGIQPVLWANVALRVVVIALFWSFGLNGPGHRVEDLPAQSGAAQ